MDPVGTKGRGSGRGHGGPGAGVRRGATGKAQGRRGVHYAGPHFFLIFLVQEHDSRIPLQEKSSKTIGFTVFFEWHFQKTLHFPVFFECSFKF